MNELRGRIASVGLLVALALSGTWCTRTQPVRTAHESTTDHSPAAEAEAADPNPGPEPILLLERHSRLRVKGERVAVYADGAVQARGFPEGTTTRHLRRPTVEVIARLRQLGFFALVQGDLDRKVETALLKRGMGMAVADDVDICLGAVDAKGLRVVVSFYALSSYARQLPELTDLKVLQDSIALVESEVLLPQGGRTKTSHDASGAPR